MLPWFTERYLQIIDRLLKQKLHHALLLSGPAGIGKYELAITLAKVILCRNPTARGCCETCQSCLLFDASTHPDFYALVSEKQLGVDKIREGIGKLSGMSQLGANKVLVIPAADLITESAANALLKTLEEPTNKTFIILLTAKAQHLLPTILSRCEKHFFSTPAPAQSLKWLKGNGVDDVTPALLEAYGNAPLRLKQALTNESGISYREFCDGFDALLAGKKDALSLANDWQEYAVQVVSWVQQFTHKSFLQSQQVQDYQNFQVCVDALKSLMHPGINKAVVLCAVLDTIANPEHQRTRNIK
ncbi:DNA polymerase III subunit [Alteromonas pelagimontana]|uniref:DNA-directed DNA polymerase n=1 Tax=Alteromonas pelagimontana TaxID=1858656 RepID=A0A6M4MA10_9ALTE|nr:DNA polymerase III subunit [Alteromonas pelagimontana]QJR79445.1 DNA polymerase III subunit [Alteromonas pelagimontana]